MNLKMYYLYTKVFTVIEMAPGDKLIDRVKYAATKSYTDTNGDSHQYTWQTISTLCYRYKFGRLLSLAVKNRLDKGNRRKVSVEKVAEAIHEVLPDIRKNKTKKILAIVVYRVILKKGYFKKEEFSLSTFRRIVSEKNLLEAVSNQNFRLKFSKEFANEMWQTDTMVGPFIYDNIHKMNRKTYLIAFIDDASRLITHAEFFFHDDEHSLATAFQSALSKRGRPEKIYCDNGANYSAKSIQMACLRIGTMLSHAPVRDGSAKGKIERFFRTFRDQFLTINHDLSSLENLNKLAIAWVENEYNDRYHNGIEMKPIDRFAADKNRIEYMPHDEYTEEIFFVEENRKVNKDNTFRFDKALYEAPVHLREQTIQIRFHSKKRDRVIVFFKDKKMGYAYVVDQHFNANMFRKNEEQKNEKERKNAEEEKIKKLEEINEQDKNNNQQDEGKNE